MNINIELARSIGGHTKQELLWNDSHRFIDAMAGRRGGKDWIMARKAVKRIYNDLRIGRGESFSSMSLRVPKLHYWFVAPTYKLNAVQKRETIKFLYQMFPADPSKPHPLIQRDISGKYELWLRPDILIEFKSAEHPETLVSEGLNGIYVTETARLKSTVWNDNLRPTLSDKGGWGLFTTTPLGHNWYIDDIRSVSEEGEKHHNDWVAYHWKTIENIMCHGLVDEVEAARLTMPLKYFIRNYEASPDAFMGQIYDEFERKIHLQKFEFEHSNYKYVLAGVDWGLTHLGAIVVFGIDRDDNVDIIDVIAESGVPAISDKPEMRTWTTIAKELKKKYGVRAFFCGPDEPDHISGFNRSGIHAVAAKNSVQAGIMFCASLIHINNDGKTRFRVRECDNTKQMIREFHSYSWHEDKKDTPLKENDDIMDAMRYGLYTAYKLRYFGITFNLDDIEEAA